MMAKDTAKVCVVTEQELNNIVHECELTKTHVRELVDAYRTLTEEYTKLKDQLGKRKKWLILIR